MTIRNKEDLREAYDCHYEGPPAWAPCEQDDNDYEPEDYHGDYEEV